MAKKHPAEDAIELIQQLVLEGRTWPYIAEKLTCRGIQSSPESICAFFHRRQKKVQKRQQSTHVLESSESAKRQASEVGRLLLLAQAKVKALEDFVPSAGASHLKAMTAVLDLALSHMDAIAGPQTEMFEVLPDGDPSATMKCMGCGHTQIVKGSIADGRRHFGSRFNFCDECSGCVQEVKRHSHEAA